MSMSGLPACRPRAGSTCGSAIAASATKPQPEPQSAANSRENLRFQRCRISLVSRQRFSPSFEHSRRVVQRDENLPDLSVWPSHSGRYSPAATTLPVLRRDGDAPGAPLRSVWADLTKLIHDLTVETWMSLCRRLRSFLRFVLIAAASPVGLSNISASRFNAPTAGKPISPCPAMDARPPRTN